MNPGLIGHPALLELRQLVARLSLISHISGTSYDGKISRDTTDDIGGGRPPGGDREYRPRAPRSPLKLGDARSEKEWDEFEDELAAWRACYQRRNSSYFARELERCQTEYRLKALRDEARETLEAWQRAPMTPGQEPLSMADSNWKRWVAESSLEVAAIVRKYGCSRQYVHLIRKGYRNVA